MGLIRDLERAAKKAKRKVSFRDLEQKVKSSRKDIERAVKSAKKSFISELKALDAGSLAELIPLLVPQLALPAGTLITALGNASAKQKDQIAATIGAKTEALSGSEFTKLIEGLAAEPPVK